MSRPEDRDFYARLAAKASSGRRFALATVVSTRGSTPRKVGTKMLVDPEEGLTGTIGGGCGEAEVIEAAREVLESGAPRMVRVDLTEDLLSWSPAVCGGIMNVFVEAVDAERPAEAPPVVRIHYHRPPDRKEVFRQHLILDEPDLKITLSTGLRFDPPLVINGRVALETGSEAVWFTYPGRWHDIGRFHRADGAFTGIYANILTPPVFRADHVWETTDLFLDLWIDPTGTLTVLDEEQLEEALGEGWIGTEQATRARHEAERLLRAFEDGTWPPTEVDEWNLERARDAMDPPSED